MAIETVNPATGERVCSFPALAEREIEDKLAAAHRASISWRRTPIAERARIVGRAGELLVERKEEYGRMMTLEMGKTYQSAVDEAAKCATACRFCAENAARLLADQPGEGAEGEGYVAFQPLGVVLAVMPWNFPFWQVIRFAAPALAAGNVGLLKHASNVPQCSLALEQLFIEAGAPGGVFQSLLIGGGQGAQEDGARAGRQRRIHRDAERAAGRRGDDGGHGADDQQRAVVHRGQAIHRRRIDRRAIHDAVRGTDARARRRR